MSLGTDGSAGETGQGDWGIRNSKRLWPWTGIDRRAHVRTEVMRAWKLRSWNGELRDGINAHEADLRFLVVELLVDRRKKKEKLARETDREKRHAVSGTESLSRRTA